MKIEVVGKVFVVVGGKRKCLICDDVFTPTQAANHATTMCLPAYHNDAYNSQTLQGWRP